MTSAPRHSFAIATLAAALLLAPVQASAFDLFGVHLWGKRDNEPPPPPDAIVYTVDVTVENADRGFTNSVKSASNLVRHAGERRAGPAALLAVARGDYQRILGVLYAEGHYGGTISITVDGQQAADMPIDAQIPDNAKVEIVVDPGPLYHFDNVEVENRPGHIPGDHRKLPKTTQELGLVRGEPAKSTVILASEAALVSRWRYKGYPKAAISDERATAVHPDDALNVYMRVEPGRPAVFGETSVEGTQYMDPAFVAYYAGITPGEPFDPEDLDRARAQLRRLDVFQAVRIVEADQVGVDGVLPITLQVAERKRRVYGGGAQYSTLDGAGVEGYWRHRNLLGRAEQLGVEGRVGGIDAQDPDEYNYLLAVNFLKPGVFTPYTDFVSRIYAEQLSPDTFRARTLGGRLGFQHRFSDRLTAQVFGQLEASTIDQTTVGDGDFLMLSLPTAINYDGSNNELNPTRGYRVGAKLEPFYEFYRSNVGLISELQGSVYVPVTTDRFVLAARAAVGSIAGPPTDDVPANRLFFAGGGGSIRGYPFRGVGPEDENGDIVGGSSYFTGSLEARIQVTDTIGVVPFIDGGNAFRSEVPDFSEPLKFGVGLGLRYQTGLGPIRFDVAVPLEPLDGDPPVGIYIGLGQAF